MRQNTDRHASGNFFNTTPTLQEQLELLFCRWWVYFVVGCSELKTGYLFRLNHVGFADKPGADQAPCSLVRRLSAKGGNLAPRKRQRGQGSVSEHTCQHRCGLTNSCILDSHYHTLARLTAILRLINKRSRRHFLFSKLP